MNWIKYSSYSMIESLPAKAVASLVLILAITTAAPAVSGEEGLFIVHFKTGAQWDSSISADKQNGFKEHSLNLNQLRQQGVILFGARYDELGLIILNASDLDAATQLIKDDPGVKAGIFDFTIAPLNVFYPWGTPAN